MTLIQIKKGKNFTPHDYDVRRQTDRSMRQREAVMSGLSKAKSGQRGDYKLCREIDKTLKDYRNHKNLNDRKKITQEYFGIQNEFRTK